jgi:hypothetical protein
MEMARPGNSWQTAETERSTLCKHLDGKALFTGLMRLYAAMHREIVESVQADPSDKQQVDEHGGFKQQRRRKRSSSDEQQKQIKKSAKPTSETRDPRIPSQLELPTRNFFAPLKTAGMELESSEDTSNQADDDGDQPPSSRRGRPPPIMLTSATNLIQLQKQLKGLVKGSFEFRNTRTGTRVVTKEMADFSAIKQYLNSQNLHYFLFFPKSLKPIKAVIRHLPGNTPAEEIYERLVELGFDIVIVKQMSTTRRSQDLTSRNLSLFLITLPRSDKSLEMIKLTSLCYISIKVEAYKSQAGLTQCHNCNQLGHDWANCKRPPCCLWCGGSHLHRECPEKCKDDSTPACCNCKLADGEKPYPLPI